MSKKTITLEEWQKEGKNLFGNNTQDWKFKCPNCGNIQSYKSIKEHNPEIKLNVDNITFNCEGRLNSKYGCDWTLGGLFQIHELEVIASENKIIKVFDFYRG